MLFVKQNNQSNPFNGSWKAKQTKRWEQLIAAAIHVARTMSLIRETNYAIIEISYALLFGHDAYK